MMRLGWDSNILKIDISWRHTLLPLKYDATIYEFFYVGQELASICFLENTNKLINKFSKLDLIGLWQWNHN